MKKQFSKEWFISILDKIEHQETLLSILYRDYSIDLIECNWWLNDSQIVKLLEYIFDDEESEWISWWCWEKEFGNNKDIDAFDENEQKIILDTSEQLYEFLLENMNGRTNIN